MGGERGGSGQKVELGRGGEDLHGGMLSKLSRGTDRAPHRAQS